MTMSAASIKSSCPTVCHVQITQTHTLTYDTQKPTLSMPPSTKPDTPPKAGLVVSTSMSRHTVEEVTKLVESELVGNAHLAGTSDFLRALLPISETAATSVAKALKGLRSFPGAKGDPIKAEKDLYKPFVDVANEIMRSYSTAKGLKTRSVWKEDANNAPKNSDESISLIRPDAVCVLEPGVEGSDLVCKSDRCNLDLWLTQIT